MGISDRELIKQGDSPPAVETKPAVVGTGKGLAADRKTSAELNARKLSNPNRPGV